MFRDDSAPRVRTAPLLLALLLVPGAHAVDALDDATAPVRRLVSSAGIEASTGEGGASVRLARDEAGEVRAAVAPGESAVPLADAPLPPLPLAVDASVVLPTLPLDAPLVTPAEGPAHAPWEEDRRGRRGALVSAAVEPPREATPQEIGLASTAILEPAPPEVAADGAAIATLALGLTALAAALAALYSRFQKHTLLFAPARARLHAHVAAHPGATLADLSEATGLGRGAIVHRAQMLERHGLLKSRHDGLHRRFYPPGAPEATERPTTPKEARLLELLRAEGPLGAAELARRLGVTRQAAHEQVKRLAREGRLAKREDGRYAPVE